MFERFCNDKLDRYKLSAIICPPCLPPPLSPPPRVCVYTQLSRPRMRANASTVKRNEGENSISKKYIHTRWEDGRETLHHTTHSLSLLPSWRIRRERGGGSVQYSKCFQVFCRRIVDLPLRAKNGQ